MFNDITNACKAFNDMIMLVKCFNDPKFMTHGGVKATP